jgi:nitric oxide reductase NorD protein
VEPEGLLIDGAQRAAVAARELWWRVRPSPARGEVPLARVKRRLEIVIGALCGEIPTILPSDPPPRATWLARALGRAPDHLSPRTAQASTDGVSVWLPRVLETVDGDDTAAVTRYRLLALEQVGRAARGTPAAAPTDRLEYDLYALAEATAVERDLARDLGGIVSDLCAARARALRDRPPFERLTALEGHVERLVQAVLSAHPATPPPGIPVTATPSESRHWARAMADRLHRPATSCRGVAIVSLWGQVIATSPASARDGGAADAQALPRGPKRSAPLRRRPRIRQAADDEDDARPGTWMIGPDEPMESVEDPMGLQRPADHDEDAAAADFADALSELPEARVVRTPGAPREVLDSDFGAVAGAPAPGARDIAGAGIVYPEWDDRLGAYRPHGAVVWPRVAPAGSGTWVEGVMARHAALVRRVRRRFDGIRPRRQRVGRQDDGPDLDLSAHVAAFADWQAGHAGDDRFYAAARPARRDLALALVVDISASTDGWVGGGLRIIDVEKESLIVLLEALDALGDRHAALAFSGEGASRVRVSMVKDFAEPLGMQTRRRVAALEPDGYTRTGAALRHASALLARQPARHRLLLVLTDGKPNDVDHYPGRYGIEDTRQAVAEARRQGLVPFCLTVDREAPVYMPTIFGPRGYALLRRQELLPAVLVEVVRRLLVR